MPALFLSGGVYMSFQSSFYNSDAAPNKLNKEAQLGTPVVLSCTAYEPISDVAGSIVIAWIDGIEEYNYVKLEQVPPIGETTSVRPRYCFVTEWIKEIGGKIRANLKIDPLMTYKQEIMQLRCVCQSASKDCPRTNTYIANNGYKVTNWTLYVSKDDPSANVETHINADLDIDPSRVVIGIYG